MRFAWGLVAALAVVAVVAVVHAAVSGSGPTTPKVQRTAGVGGLARRYQPTLVLSRRDGFWPVSVQTITRLRFDGRGPCLSENGRCEPLRDMSQVPWLGDPTSFIEYPGGVTRPSQQHRSLLAALRGDADPFDSSEVYVLQTGGGPGQTTTLQYWFYYSDDYQLIRGAFGAKGGFHEGDLESAGVLLSRDTHRPVYVWTARHAAEGTRFAWNEPDLTIEGTHPVLWEARGSHASYESCGRRKHRPEGGGLIDDTAECGGTFRFSAANTPLADLARAPWTCWRGFFGHAYVGTLSRADRALVQGHVVADAPRAPLWQQGFDRAHSHPCLDVAPPATRAGSGDATVPEATAQALRAHAGRYDSLFDDCADWQQRPTSGGYLVACDDADLRRFFASGLEDPGSTGLRIDGPQRARGPTVPAVYRSADVRELEQATITADRPVAPIVYASAFRGNRALAARFAHVALRPGLRVALRLGSRWRLVDEVTRRVIATAAPRAIGTLARPPAPTELAAAPGAGDAVKLSFAGSHDPDASFLVYVAPSAAALAEAAPVAAIDATPTGSYATTVVAPGAHAALVVAERFGQARAGAPIAF